MEKFIPYEKLSKKEKRKLNAAKRTTWDISPVTRRSENPKAYNRKKTHREFRDDSAGASFVYTFGGKKKKRSRFSLFRGQIRTADLILTKDALRRQTLERTRNSKAAV